MKKIILFFWQLPQNILGYIICLLTGSVYDSERRLCYWKKHSGLSLAYFIFVNENASDFTVKHEEGHQVQSKMLGPLYLLVIGLPSLIWCCLKTLGFFKNKSYYWFYTEKWANKISKI